MEFLAPASIILNGLLVVVCFALWQSTNEVARLLEKAKQDIAYLKSQKSGPDYSYLEKILNLTRPSLPSQVLDDRTKNLLNLAVKNTNEHEARTAAVEVCKRLYKKLNKE